MTHNASLHYNPVFILEGQKPERQGIIHVDQLLYIYIWCYYIGVNGVKSANIYYKLKYSNIINKY